MVNELTLNNNPINNNELVTEKEQNGFYAFCSCRFEFPNEMGKSQR